MSGSTTNGALGCFSIPLLSEKTNYILEFWAYSYQDNLGPGVVVGDSSGYAYIYVMDSGSFKTSYGQNNTPNESRFSSGTTVEGNWKYYVVTRNGQQLNLKIYNNDNKDILYSNTSTAINNRISNTYQGISYGWGGGSVLVVRGIKIKIIS